MNAQNSEKSAINEYVRHLGEVLVLRNLSCAVAESCTGGMIGAAFTAVAGSSQWFRGGVIAYCNEVKASVLSVPEAILVTHGAVSAETVSAMASGVAGCIHADCAVAVSGIAGPDGGSAEKPVGLVYTGVFYNGHTDAQRHLFYGDREAVRSAAALAALEHVLGCLDIRCE